MAKPKEPKPIAPIFEELTQPTWWKYRDYLEEEINNITTLLQTRQKDLTFTSDLYENLRYLYRTIGLHPHPCLNPKSRSPELQYRMDIFGIPDRNDPVPIKEPPKEEKKTLNRKDTKKMSKKNVKQEEDIAVEPPIPPFIVKAFKVDLVLLKLLNYCWGQSKTTHLKLIKNELDDHIEETLVQMLANPTMIVNQFFFELNTPLNMERFVNILMNPNLEFLSLRSCAITDEMLRMLCEALKGNSTLRFLELFDNEIKEGIKYFIPLLSIETCNIEYVGLGRNNLSAWQILEEWFDRIGRFPLTADEVENYRDKEREREANIQKNLKNKNKKGYINEPVEYLDPVVQKEDESWIMIKGGKLKMISLAFNKFDDTSVEKFDKFLERQAPEFCLVLTGNPIQKPLIDKLINVHGNKVISN